MECAPGLLTGKRGSIEVEGLLNSHEHGRLIKNHPVSEAVEWQDQILHRHEAEEEDVM